ALFAAVVAGQPVAPVAGGDVGADLTAMTKWEAAKRYFPSLLRASGVTIVLSCLSMALAVGIGVIIATGRVYGGRVARLALTSYVELGRGPPLPPPLFAVYYGLAARVPPPAFRAAASR